MFARPLLLLGLLIAAPASGCGTLVNHSPPGSMLNCNGDYRPYRPYGGVCTDLELFGESYVRIARGELTVYEAVHVAAFAPLLIAVDLPLSALIDTALLPWDVKKELAWRRGGKQPYSNIIPHPPQPQDVPAYKLADEPLYFPTTVGTKWVYRDSRENYGTRTQVVTQVEDVNGAKIVSVGEVGSDGQVAPLQDYSVFKNGLSCIAREGSKLQPPQTWLKLPIESGKEWEFESLIHGGTVRLAMGEKETIVVPAGTFRAVRVVFNYPSTWFPAERSTTVWFAPDVGIVKQSGKGFELVLISFTPGKE